MTDIKVVEDVNRYKREKLYKDCEWAPNTLAWIEVCLGNTDLCKSVESTKIYDRFVEIAEEYILTLSNEDKKAKRKALGRYRAQVVGDTYRALKRIFEVTLANADRKKCLNIICKIYVRYSESFPLLEPPKHPLNLLF